MSNSDPTTTLLSHVNRTLPDSLSERKRLLLAMAKVMTPKHPAWKDVQGQIDAVERALEFQATAQLQFQSLTQN